VRADPAQAVRKRAEAFTQVRIVNGRCNNHGISLPDLFNQPVKIVIDDATPLFPTEPPPVIIALPATRDIETWQQKRFRGSLTLRQPFQHRFHRLSRLAFGIPTSTDQ
jgi:hypothetical protein